MQNESEIQVAAKKDQIWAINDKARAEALARVPFSGHLDPNFDQTEISIG